MNRSFDWNYKRIDTRNWSENKCVISWSPKEMVIRSFVQQILIEFCGQNLKHPKYEKFSKNFKLRSVTRAIWFNAFTILCGLVAFTHFNLWNFKVCFSVGTHLLKIGISRLLISTWPNVFCHWSIGVEECQFFAQLVLLEKKEILRTIQ